MRTKSSSKRKARESKAYAKLSFVLYYFCCLTNKYYFRKASTFNSIEFYSVYIDYRYLHVYFYYDDKLSCFLSL